jgi:sugar phosphate isomerase/epimerase
MGISPELLVSRVQVNIPFAFLLNGYLSLFLAKGLNPEIGLDAGSLSHNSPRTFRRLARMFQQAGRRLTLHAPFQDLAPGALDDEVLAASRRRLRQAFRWLPVFRPAAVVCHLGYEARHYRWDVDQWLARSAATFRELAGIAAPYGVTVMLENVYETEKELFAEVISRVKAQNLKVCFDVGHLLAFGDGDFAGWLETLWPHIGHLHLHDNQGDGDHHLALGAGKVPVDYVLNFLADKGVRPLITLEPHQEGSLAPSLDYLAKIWPWD